MWERIRSFLLENRTTRQTVAKNTVWLTVSNFGGRLIKAGVILYAARVLGTAGYGVFSYAATLAGFFTFFVDPGVNAILIRDGARSEKEDRRTLFSSAFILKIVFVAVGAALVIFIAPLISILPGAKALIPFVVLIMVFDSLREFFASFFRAEEKMQWDAAAFILENLGIAIFGFILLRASPSPLSFTLAYAAGTAVGAITAIWLIRRSFGELLSHISFPRMRGILAAAWPFAITSALGILFTNTDILIISWMRSASEVGIYSAAIRIVQVLYLIPGIIQVSTLPAFARFAKKDDAKFREGLERTLGLIFLISIPISLGGAILSAPIMKLVFGAPYTTGGTALAVLMLGLLFDFTAVVVSNAIFSYNHQKSLITASIIGATSNVFLDLILIPHFGITGSAFATFIAQIASNAYLWYAMKKLSSFRVLHRLRKITVASVGMAALTTLLLAAHVNVLLNIALSGAFYFVLLSFFREPFLAEIKSVLVPSRADAAGPPLS